MFSYFLQAKELHAATGAHVMVKIISVGNKLHLYDSSGTTRRNVGTQFGKPTLPPVKKVTRQSNTKINTPKKLSRRISTTLPALKVTGMPGKVARNSEVNSEVSSTSKTTGKCKICKIIWESKEDQAFRKEAGKRKSTWVGCDEPSCKFWAHATCAGLVLIPRKKVEHHKYLCQRHK